VKGAYNMDSKEVFEAGLESLERIAALNVKMKEDMS